MTVAEQVKSSQDRDAMLIRSLEILAAATGKTVSQIYAELKEEMGQ